MINVIFLLQFSMGEMRNEGLRQDKDRFFLLLNGINSLHFLDMIHFLDLKQWNN